MYDKSAALAETTQPKFSKFVFFHLLEARLIGNQLFFFPQYKIQDLKL